MKLKLGLLLAGLAVPVVLCGVLSPVGNASAADDPAIIADGIVASNFYDAKANAGRPMRNSIVYCAAKTMGIEVDQVKLGLRRGESLKEIGIRAGVRPVQLENGILRCERNLLERLVSAEKLDPATARRIMHFLTTHITRIINHSWDGPTTDAAPGN